MPVATNKCRKVNFFFPSAKERRDDQNGIDVRVVEYALADKHGNPASSSETIYRLVTTILDPEAAPAQELAALYLERWEIENAFDELKHICVAEVWCCEARRRI